MYPADIYTGWVTSGGAVVLLDSYSNDQLQPTIDNQQHFSNVRGKEANGVTLLQFTRPLDTGDGLDVSLAGQARFLIWAYSRTQKGFGQQYAKHTATGSSAFQLRFDGAPTDAPILTSSGGGGGGGGGSGSLPTLDNSTGWTVFRSSSVDFSFSWIINGSDITMVVEAGTRGWISVGFGSAYKMTGLICFTGWVADLTGATVLQRENSIDYNQPRLAEQLENNPAYHVAGQQVAGRTRWQLTRPLASTSSNDVDLSGPSIVAVYALGSSDGYAGRYAEHYTYGAVQLSLAAGSVGPELTRVSPRPSPGALLCLLVLVYLLCHAGWYYIVVRRWWPYAGAAGQRWWLNLIPIWPINSTLQQLLISAVYVAVNVACLLADATGKGVHIDMASLILANATITVILATKSSVILVLLGQPFESVLWMHRWLGRITFVAALCHTVLSWLQWKEDNIALSTTITDSKYFYGLLSLISLFLIGLTSINYIRRIAYEVFFLSHYFVVTFLVFGFLHAPEACAPFVVCIIVVLVLDFAVRAFGAHLIPRRVRKVRVCGDVVQLNLDSATWSKKRCVRGWFLFVAVGVEKLGWRAGYWELGRTPGYWELGCWSGWRVLARQRLRSSLFSLFFSFACRYHAGQYILVNIPQVSWYQWHPFSLTSGEGDNQLQISVRGRGGYTNRLLQLAKGQAALTVRMSGPYGFRPLQPNIYPIKAFVCGGIGITPAISVLKTIYRQPTSALGSSLKFDTVVPLQGWRGPVASGPVRGSDDLELVSVESSTDPEPAEGGLPSGNPQGAVYVVWVVRKAADYEWFREAFDEAYSIMEAHPGQFPDLCVSVHLTDKTADARTVPQPLQFGRPKIRDLLLRMRTNHPDQPMMVHACGPDSLVQDAKKAAGDIRRRGCGCSGPAASQSLYFHEETFEW